MSQGEVLDEMFEAFLRALIDDLHKRDKDIVASALFCFLVREANTWRSIQSLRKSTPEDFHSVFMVDVGTLLRAMFDAYLQAHYVVCKPEEREQKARDYLDFQIVERYVSSQQILAHENPLTERLIDSPARAEGESRLKSEFDRVEGRFRASTNHRKPWYKGGLPNLARVAEKSAEYDSFVAFFSGCVHSSALAVLYGPMIKERDALFFASKLAARVAKIKVQYHNLYIDNDQVLIDQLSKGWIER